MSYRIIIEKPGECEHDWQRWGCLVGYCSGGERSVLTEPSPEMVERAAEASFVSVYPDGVWKKSGALKQRESFRRSARAALTAALFEEATE